MSRRFRTPDYDATLKATVSLDEALPAHHLARFVVDLVAQLDLSPVYARYAPSGGEAIAPEALLALLFYGYATGVFSSRKIEQATHENLAFRFVAGGLHPDHDTIAHFRKTFLAEIQDLFVQTLLLAKLAGVLKRGNLSLDGSKIHADASKSHAVSYQRLIELETRLRAEVQDLLSLGEQADQGDVSLPGGLRVEDAIALRQKRLASLAPAKAVLDARAQDRYQAEQAAYDAKRRTYDEKARRKKRRGRRPQPPEPGPHDGDQYNFTDPDSRITPAPTGRCGVKNSTNDGFDQHYNVQAAVDQASLLIVAPSLSNHPNDQREVEPTLDALAPQLGQPKAAALDNGYFSEANVQALEARGIEPFIATGREPHQLSWRAFFAAQPAPPSEAASLKDKMAYKLRTEIGQAIYRLRTPSIRE